VRGNLIEKGEIASLPARKQGLPAMTISKSGFGLGVIRWKKIRRFWK
jgi:hypothetical protein